MEGYSVKEYGQAVKRYVQTMDLKDDPALIAEYRRRQEWEDYMAMFQQCKEGATSDEKWQMMERIIYLY